MSHQNSSPSMEHLNCMAATLISNSVSANTKGTYKCGLEKFRNFRQTYRLLDNWPVPIADLLSFIAYLSWQGLKASTVSTYIASLSYTHKVNGFTDTTTSFLVVKAKEGLTRTQGGRPADIRSPITLPMLTKLIHNLQFVCNNRYEQALFTAAFALAFFGLLRISEFTSPTSKQASPKALQLLDVTLNPAFMKVLIRWSKTDQRGMSVPLHIPCHAASYCPVRSMQNYLHQRPRSEGTQLFIHSNLRPLTRFQFNAVLKRSLHFADIPSHIRSHSFRIGGATYLSQQGLSDTKIMAMGRWKSGVFSRYIRLST